MINAFDCGALLRNYQAQPRADIPFVNCPVGSEKARAWRGSSGYDSAVAVVPVDTNQFLPAVSCEARARKFLSYVFPACRSLGRDLFIIS